MQVTAGFASQTSCVTLPIVIGTSLWFGGHSTAGEVVMDSDGAVVSTTFTTVLQLDVLPRASTALQPTVVEPMGNDPPPHDAVQPQLSSQVAVSVAGVPAPAHSTVLGAGHWTAGDSPSTTSTVETQVEVEASTAVLSMVTECRPGESDCDAAPS